MCGVVYHVDQLREGFASRAGRKCDTCKALGISTALNKDPQHIPYCSNLLFYAWCSAEVNFVIERTLSVQNNHRAWRSSRSKRAASISEETGLRRCRRSRNSANVGFVAISRISQAGSQKGTCRPWRRELSGHGARYPAHCEAESSSACSQHACMCCAC